MADPVLTGETGAFHGTFEFLVAWLAWLLCALQSHTESNGNSDASLGPASSYMMDTLLAVNPSSIGEPLILPLLCDICYALPARQTCCYARASSDPSATLWMHGKPGHYRTAVDTVMVVLERFWMLL